MKITASATIIRFPPKRTLILVSCALVLFAFFLTRSGEDQPKPLPTAIVIESAEAAIRSPDQQAARQAMIDLGRTGDRATAALAAQALAQHPAPEVRAAAANALGRLEVWETMPTLVAALMDEDLRVRAKAFVAVSKILGQRYTCYDPRASAEERTRCVETIRNDYPQWKALHIDWLERRGIQHN